MHINLLDKGIWLYNKGVLMAQNDGVRNLGLKPIPGGSFFGVLSHKAYPKKCSSR